MSITGMITVRVTRMLMIGLGLLMGRLRRTLIGCRAARLGQTIHSINERFVTMIDHHEFHDGTLEGFWLDDSTVHVHLRTWRGERFTAVAHEIAALSATGFKVGNIIFEVIIRESVEITKQDAEDLYDLQDGLAGQEQIGRLMDDAKARGLRALEINPSYGGRCLVLAASINFLPRSTWFEQILLARSIGAGAKHR